LLIRFNKQERILQVKRIAAILTIVFIIIVILSIPSSAQSDDCNFPLIAGKKNLTSGISAGSVKVTKDSDNLYVDFETVDGWVMTETHLYVGGAVPQKSAPGQFPHKHEPEEAFTQYTFNIPLNMISTDDNGYIYFAAHAALQKVGDDGVALEETAWAGNFSIRDTGTTKAKNWALYFKCTGDTGVDTEDNGDTQE